jgi:alginate O-acetyltransferase complex protein AlgI
MRQFIIAWDDNMSVFLPHYSFIWPSVIAAWAATIIIGFVITRFSNFQLARIFAWMLAITSAITVSEICKNAPPGFRMLAIIGILFYSMKALVSIEARKDGEKKLKALNWLCFTVGWFGMRPSLFSTLGRKPAHNANRLIWMGAIRLIIGILLILYAKLLWLYFNQINKTFLLMLVTPFLLSGLSLILHFGILNIVAGVWRNLGVNCHQLFINPLKSTSLAEFWGHRWNRAFSEMTTVSVYRPMLPFVGKKTAIIAAFAFSGLLHEMAISLPVNAGYGMPLTYFLLQGSLVLLEKNLQQIDRPLFNNEWIGRIWTLICLILPLPLLFHRHFLNGIIWPLLGI